MSQTTEHAFETYVGIVARYMSDQDFQRSAFPILAKEIFEAIRARSAAPDRVP